MSEIEGRKSGEGGKGTRIKTKCERQKKIVREERNRETLRERKRN